MDLIVPEFSYLLASDMSVVVPYVTWLICVLIRHVELNRIE